MQEEPQHSWEELAPHDPPDYPRGVTFLSISYFFIGIIAFLLAFVALGKYGFVFLCLTVAALAYGAAGYGLWHLRKWSWWLAVFVECLNLLYALTGMGVGMTAIRGSDFASFLNVVIQITIIGYLLATRSIFFYYYD